MEGVTGYVYRGALNRTFGGYDKYFIPFISPNQKGRFSAREREDVLPSHNCGMYAVPQILTRNPDDFIETAEKLVQLGYKEINFNLGCPSKTVTSKGRGAGFLQYPEELLRFLDRIFSWGGADISIKTRIGTEHVDEFAVLLSIYERFPYKELIVHPRLQVDYYKYPVRPESFLYACEYLGETGTAERLCYNGDIFDVSDFWRMTERFPSVERIMCGRGMLRNPGLAQMIRGGSKPTRDKLVEFHGEIYDGLREIMPGERPVLFKMKEIWLHMQELFHEEERTRPVRHIKKARSLSEYETAVRALFSCPCLYDGDSVMTG